MKCPYCGAEWEHDYDDLSYTEKEGEYKCPSCERIFVMSGGTYILFRNSRRIMFVMDFVEYYKNQIAMFTERGDKETAKHYKSMLDMYHIPELKELEKALKRCIEHNKKVGEVDDID